MFQRTITEKPFLPKYFRVSSIFPRTSLSSFIFKSFFFWSTYSIIILANIFLQFLTSLTLLQPYLSKPFFACESSNSNFTLLALWNHAVFARLQFHFALYSMALSDTYHILKLKGKWLKKMLLSVLGEILLGSRREFEVETNLISGISK